ncbi:hypothetical protein FRX31_004340 [Thalictrum thalictroides]|uniref:Uncharacterized protein n=1 Tax=Thalictrum thalictroides TaxID=46969 RepID=A0A7J6XB62_THATH|nr:hypothetical protein FRX31_004340 [Thalictrum thalictroides]
MANQTWSDLFRSSTSHYVDTTLEFLKPTYVDGIAEVPSEIINEDLEFEKMFSITTDNEMYYFNSWKPPSCTICKCFGHKTDKRAKAPPKVWVEKQGRRRVNNNDSEAGPSGLKNGENVMELALIPID